MKTRTAPSRPLRARQADAEQALWHGLRQRHLAARFRRHHRIGPYVVNLACPDARLVIEFGGRHPESIPDQVRDLWLRHHGYQVLRFCSEHVVLDAAMVTAKIALRLRQRTPGGARP